MLGSYTNVMGERMNECLKQKNCMFIYPLFDDRFNCSWTVSRFKLLLTIRRGSRVVFTRNDRVKRGSVSGRDII